MSVFIASGFISSLSCKVIGCEDRLWNDLLLCQVGRETVTQSVNNAGCVLSCFVLVEQNSSMWLMTMLRDLQLELLSVRYAAVIVTCISFIVRTHLPRPEIEWGNQTWPFVFICCYSVCVPDECLHLLDVVSTVLDQEIGWEERLQNDVFRLKWDVKPQLKVRLRTQLITGNSSLLPSVLWHCWLGVGHSMPVKNWVMKCLHGYLSGARCKRFAYGPADATVTPSSLASLKSRQV